ncbi:uncharacterized protein [Polyergus mexicanus]|uniref:uncharacterized protein n=1 Tax=Polyergus mexicanus TaxID=615972 RepID=UPI0038B48548
MAAMCKLQYLLIIGVCLQLRFSYGFPSRLPYNGIKIVTYGEPCHPSRYLPVTIKEPVRPVTENALSTTPCAYQPLKLNYQVIDQSPVFYQPQAKYPISIQVPKVEPVESLEIVKPDSYRGKSYIYNTQTPLSSISVPISTSYNFDLQVPSSPIQTEISSTSQPVKLLTGLTSRIDKVLIPACELPAKCACQVN